MENDDHPVSTFVSKVLLARLALEEGHDVDIRVKSDNVRNTVIPFLDKHLREFYSHRKKVSDTHYVYYSNNSKQKE